MEAHDNLWVDDMVQSLWKHKAGYNPGQRLTIFVEYKRYPVAKSLATATVM
jgi:hypothetical protein